VSVTASPNPDINDVLPTPSASLEAPDSRDFPGTFDNSRNRDDDGEPPEEYDVRGSNTGTGGGASPPGGPDVDEPGPTPASGTGGGASPPGGPDVDEGGPLEPVTAANDPDEEANESAQPDETDVQGQDVRGQGTRGEDED